MAAIRAEWLAQLAKTIEAAQRLAWQLGTRESACDEARELYGRLEAARLDAHAMLDAAEGQTRNIETDWLQKLGWSGALLDTPD